MEAPAGNKNGWKLVCGLLLVMTVCHGIITSALPTLDKAILDELGISRGELKLRESIFMISSGLAGLGIGFLTRYIAPARIVITGLVVLSATLLAYSQAASIQQIYMLYVVFGACFASSHVVIIVLLIRERFSTRRAFATSVALSGTSIGSALLPPIAVFALEQWPWREFLQVLAIVPVIALPLVAFLISGGKPKSAEGTEAEGDAPVAAEAPATRRTKLGIALLIIATFGTFFGSSGILMNLFLYLQDVGLTPRIAAAGMTTFFLLGLFGKVLVGLAAERWGSHTMWTSQHFILLGGAILLTSGSANLAFPGLILLGWGWAGCYVLTQVVIANFFAGPRLGQLTGAFIMLEAIGSGAGIWLAGSTFDRFGSYQFGFGVCTAMIVIALIAGVMLRKVINKTEREDRELAQATAA